MEINLKFGARLGSFKVNNKWSRAGLKFHLYSHCLTEGGQTGLKPLTWITFHTTDHIPSPGQGPSQAGLNTKYFNLILSQLFGSSAHRSQQDENICICCKSKQNLRKTFSRLKTSLVRSYLVYCESCLWDEMREERHARQCNNDFLLLSGFIGQKMWFMSLQSVFL